MTNPGRGPAPRPSRQLPLHAAGAPAPWPVVASALVLAHVCWLAAAAALVPASDRLAAGAALAQGPVLAAHLLGAAFFPFAVAGAAWHLLPVMLRNRLPSVRRLWLALALLGGGPVLAPGVAASVEPLAWTGAGLLAAGLVLALVDVAGLVLRAPRGKVLVASRTGIALSGFHAAAGFTLGAIAFGLGGPSPLGIPYERLVLMHLVVAVLGWLTLLVVAVGRTLAPMLALAPAPGPRRGPLAEIALAGGLWLLAAGLAAERDALAAAGLSAVLLALSRFGLQLVGVAREHRTEAVEGPLAHLLAGAVFLAEAGGLGLVALAGGVDARRAAVAAAVLLVLGWGAGVIVGHAGKLLSLSAWVWWPPGPRPKQHALYARAVWQAEAAAFAAGSQVLAAGIVAGSEGAARSGAALLCVAAALALVGALETVRRALRRPGQSGRE